MAIEFAGIRSAVSQMVEDDTRVLPAQRAQDARQFGARQLKKCGPSLLCLIADGSSQCRGCWQHTQPEKRLVIPSSPRVARRQIGEKARQIRRRTWKADNMVG